ncbi:plastocyanin [Mycobacterium sp. NS-7484]|uniref:cupredoxin domain-containing protein n=1 Tax=unclassified Mycobacterium TaxID=2642494 RepID=UPI000801F6AA|nr:MULTISPECIES: cupredoxin domain-containing protein [unclassified Mycobacterium]OBG86427.1 plastocyanin [Mycobacterium sp. E802]OMB99433.1 plastocyanin [Mycobacterium sp. NS-7484]
MNRLAMLVVAACLGAWLTVACSQADHAAPQQSTVQPAPGGPTITIAGMGFSKALTVAPGTHIAIVNDDEVEHSVTSRDKGVFDVHVDGKGRATLTAPDKPGQYAFYCLYHPAMVGTLTVR